ncbi:hypothetical protein FLP41_15270 [Paracoccus marcusii]|uniref:hypothetical protein n=1 Tax=Paracoccus marcusii TaxID=59779 RepID=UPI002ED2F959|nr:hypothetical protein FLP41_15270 [Paracoccus marcusii]
MSTIKSALEGKASQKTKDRIRETLIGAATAGGVRPLGRQVGEWVVAMPEGRAADKVGVIAEAVVFHMSEPMVVVHITHRMGVAGSPEGRCRDAVDRAGGRSWRGSQADGDGDQQGEQFIKHQLDAIRAYKLRQEAVQRAMTIGSIGDDKDLVERSAFRELLVSGNVEKTATRTRTCSERRTKISKAFGRDQNRQSCDPRRGRRAQQFGGPREPGGAERAGLHAPAVCEKRDIDRRIRLSRCRRHR